ncbi:MAG: 30S ribosome-binding factor RbfA [Clostridiales bacterium]|jgi:ribosome-binding factor A|nr:30S ribosome-binding factor RbfA [Clostridiales bacterium]
MSIRLQRIGSEMQKALSQIIRDLKDYRITEMVSVTGVEVSKDLEFAKVYVSIYGDSDKVQSTFEGLLASSGYIRKELTKHFKDIRHTPQVRFMLDTSMEYAEKINKLIDDVKK